MVKLNVSIPRRLLLCFIMNIALNVYGQREIEIKTDSNCALDLNAAKAWPSVNGGAISDNGEYVFYYISNEAPGTSRLIITSTKTSWEKSYVNAAGAVFTPDSRHVIFKTETDGLMLLTLGTDEITCAGAASSYKVSGDSNNVWFGYLNKTDDGVFALRNLSNGREYQMHSVKDYIFSADYKSVLLLCDSAAQDDKMHVFRWLRLQDFRSTTIWYSAKELPVNYAFDRSGKQAVFLTKKQDEKDVVYNLWYAQGEMDSSECILASGSGDTIKLTLHVPGFSDDGKLVIFEQEKNKLPVVEYEQTKVDVWNYRDEMLQSEQMEDRRRLKSSTYVMSMHDKSLIRLNAENERVLSIGKQYALIIHELGKRGIHEAYWNYQAQLSYSLVSLHDGTRKLLRDKIVSYDGGVQVSPNWKWAVYYDFKTNSFLSIDLKSFTSKNISAQSNTNWLKTENAYPIPSLAGWVTWSNRGDDILISDNYDMWRLDPAGKRKPENLTNGYGKRYQVKFELLNEEDVSQGSRRVLIKGFNKITKEYGFYQKILGTKGDPEILSKGQYIYGWWGGYGSVNYPPLKARETGKYLVVRMKADQAPNYFITENFKRFHPISDLQPQKNFKWYTTEVFTWRTADGHNLQGILYKPQDFDSTKKYPVIFDYYERRSDELNMYISPKPSEGRINIPMFVSNGYLVFVPDIHYGPAGPGMSAWQSLTSAARYLSHFKWIDVKRMGLQGHSFGGYETNFIITRTNMFAAACSASGFCDLISAYNSGARGGYPMYASEKGQKRLAGTPWQKPELYIVNSPIYSAEKITTPLLLMNNKNDKVVPFSQGLEFFVALRRLGKKVWMLQYDNGGHEVDGPDAEDFHTRMLQFFDHFLKEKPAPVWMTQGVPAKNKSIDSGLELDPNPLKAGLDQQD